MITITNPAFDYNKHGQTYSGYRQTDSRIENFVHQALGKAKTILNVGAGAGSYEPENKYVIALEPSREMRKQRIQKGITPAINGFADNLPFDDNSFDASMAIVTIHHWSDMKKGLQELKRVTKNKVVIMTFDPHELENFWNFDYFPELVEIEKKRYPTIDFIKAQLAGEMEVINVPIPFDCKDGFQEAFYGRPEAFLEKKVRLNQSAWGFLPEGLEDTMVERLSKDLASGVWDEKYGKHRKMETFMGSLKLITSYYR